MKLTISKIDKILFAGEADSVAVPGRDGEMVVLSHHMPLITTLKAGKVTVKTKEGGQESYTIKRGMLEVSKNETVILV